MTAFSLDRKVSYTLQLLAIFIFLGLSLFFALAPYSPGIQSFVLAFMVYQAPFCWVLSLLSFSLAIFGTYFLYKKFRRFHIQSSTHKVSVELLAMQQSIQGYFQEHLYAILQSPQVHLITGQKIEITASLCSEVSNASLEHSLEKVEQGLGLFLKQTFDYEGPFYLIIRS